MGGGGQAGSAWKKVTKDFTGAQADRLGTLAPEAGSADLVA